MNIDVVLASQNPDELCALVLKLFVNQEPQTQRSQTLAGYIQQREEALKNARQWRFGRKSEAFQGEQRGLFDEDIEADAADIEQQLVTLLPEPKAPKYLRPRQGQNPTRLSVALYRRTRCRAGDSAYDCQSGRSGQYARDVLEGWRVTLVVDGDAGYQALFGKRPGG